MVSGKMENVMEWEDKCGKMVHFMKDTGLTMLPMAREDSSKLEETSMKEIGSMTKLKEREYISIKMALHTLVNGSMTSNTVMVMKNGQTEPNTREITLKD